MRKKQSKVKIDEKFTMNFIWAILALSILANDCLAKKKKLDLDFEFVDKVRQSTFFRFAFYHFSLVFLLTINSVLSLFVDSWVLNEYHLL